MEYKKDYHRIDWVVTREGLLELWENDDWGDEVPALVVLNGEVVDETMDDIFTYLKEN